MTPMMLGVIAVLVAVVFAVLAVLAIRARNIFVKIVGGLLALVVTVLAALIAIVDFNGITKLNATHDIPVKNLKVAGTPEQIARGEQLTKLCVGCHSSTGGQPLGGATASMLGEEGKVIAELYPPNLTPGGDLKNWSDGEIIRAIREGVDREGKALIIMPSEVFHNYADADVEAVVAYLRSQPAVTNNQPDRKMGVLGTLLIGAGQFPAAVQEPITQPIVAPPAGKTVEYGKYLVSISGCEACHGANLAGGKATPGGGGPPIGPNLTQIVPRWTETEFLTTIRTGTNPAGKKLDQAQMPWNEYSAMYSDDELKAIYMHLHGLEPKATNPVK